MLCYLCGRFVHSGLSRCSASCLKAEFLLVYLPHRFFPLGVCPYVRIARVIVRFAGWSGLVGLDGA